MVAEVVVADDPAVLVVIAEAFLVVGAFEDAVDAFVAVGGAFVAAHVRDDLVVQIVGDPDAMFACVAVDFVAFAGREAAAVVIGNGGQRDDDLADVVGTLGAHRLLARAAEVGHEQADQQRDQ